MTGAAGPDDRVFAMGESALVAPDFPPLTVEELVPVLGDEPLTIEWRSRRPLSATARVRLGDGTGLVVKRMPARLRDRETLAPEHAFMNHLRAQGIPIPRVRVVSHDGFTYELQEPGVGEDRYRDDFSWSPYHRTADAKVAGAMLARLHLAAAGFDAPERPPHPLLAALCTDAVADVERYASARPAVGRFLAEQHWRAESDFLANGHAPDLAAAVSALPALWTHNDWHGTNLLWSGEQITSVLDFGLANRTVAVFDLATAVERFAIDWLSIAQGGPARIRTGQLAAFLRAYCAVRPLDPVEREVLPELFPLVHITYELSEIDYFLTIPPRRQVRNARIAYRNYFLGRSVWAASAEGKAFTTMLRGLSAECC